MMDVSGHFRPVLTLASDQRSSEGLLQPRLNFDCHSKITFLIHWQIGEFQDQS